MAVLRTEEWVREDPALSPMVSTFVVDIHDREVVLVSDHLKEEFGLSRQQQVYWDHKGWAEYPYTYVSGRLHARGWRRAL